MNDFPDDATTLSLVNAIGYSTDCGIDCRRRIVGKSSPFLTTDYAALGWGRNAKRMECPSMRPEAETVDVEAAETEELLIRMSGPAMAKLALAAAVRAYGP